MKTIHAPVAPMWAAFLLVIALSVSPARPDAGPPEQMTYQGFVVDANGVALGNITPKNYDVVFRIFDAQSNGSQLWAEQQTVTVDKGYFSVLLGEGAQAGSEPRPALSTLFRATDNVSDRFVELTVKGIGPSNSDVTIKPRLRLITSPYAFLAQNAVSLVSGTNQIVSTVAGNVGINAGLNVDGTMTASSLAVNGAATVGSLNTPGAVTAASFAGNGAGLANLDASKIASGTLNADRIPSTLSGDKTFPGKVSIGHNNAPDATLDVRGTVSLFGAPQVYQTLTPTAGEYNVTHGPYATDGFFSVMLFVQNSSVESRGRIIGLVDGVWVGMASVSRWGDSYSLFDGFTMPVAKGRVCRLEYRPESTHQNDYNNVRIAQTWTPIGR